MAAIEAPSKGKGEPPGWVSRAWKRLSAQSTGPSRDPRSDAKRTDDNEKLLWNDQIASALGYGSKGAASYQWWITAASTITCLVSYIVWCVYVFQAKEQTAGALAALGIRSSMWENGQNVLLATAVLYPLLVLLAVAVSLWRASLACQLNRHVLMEAKWRRHCRHWQGANAASNVLLWGMMLFMVISITALGAWIYTTNAADMVGYGAIQNLKPMWEGLTNIANSARDMSSNFTSLLDSLPAIGRRRVLSETAKALGLPGWDFEVPGSGASPGGDELVTTGGPQGELAAAEAVAVAAGVGAVRALQQLPPLIQGITGAVQAVGNALSGANAATQPLLSGMRNALNATGQALGGSGVIPQVIPAGNDNPLVQTLKGLVSGVQDQILNSTGCPVYCIDARSVDWIEDGCLCDLKRVEAAMPYVSATAPLLVPAMGAALCMWIGGTWLLLHGVSQWGRTRTEGKLMKRVPGAVAAVAGVGSPYSPVRSPGSPGSREVQLIAVDANAGHYGGGSGYDPSNQPALAIV